MSVPVRPPVEHLCDGDDGQADAREREHKESRLVSSANIAALAAASAACLGELLTTVLFFPLELVKCRIQAATECAEDGNFAYAGLGDGLLSVLREAGVSGLFAGLPSVALRSLAAEFATVGFGELLLGRYMLRFGSSGSAGAMALVLRTLGGCASISMTLPLETLATRITTSRRPLSMAGAVRQLWSEGGLAAFWKGLLVSFVLCLNPALMLTTVVNLRALVLRLRRGVPGAVGDDGKGGTDAEPQQLSWLEAPLVGVVAKLFTMSLIYPLVRGKVLLQARNTNGTGLLQVLGKSRRKDGIRSWYRGLGAQMSKSLLSATIKYTVKERVERPIQQLIHTRAQRRAPQDGRDHDGNKAAVAR